MTKREPILKLLKKHIPADEQEQKSLNEIITFIEANEECFENDLKQGHITGSALVVDENLEYALLTHHTKLNKWLQFGGHSDGYNIVSETAFREAQEESGLKSLKFHPAISGVFDVDVHLIPKKGEMPAHNHHDVRFLLIGDKNEQFLVSSESKDLKWIKLEEIGSYSSQPAFLRMINKVIKLRNNRNTSDPS